jgi:hypothetical protein
MKIESTAVEMLWKEKNTVFCEFIYNICAEKKRNSLKLRKTDKAKKFKSQEMSFRSING